MKMKMRALFVGRGKRKGGREGERKGGGRRRKKTTVRLNICVRTVYETKRKGDLSGVFYYVQKPANPCDISHRSDR